MTVEVLFTAFMSWLSKQLGVSWYWWMDAGSKGQKLIYYRFYTDGEPAVKYRGIFLNE